MRIRSFFERREAHIIQLIATLSLHSHRHRIGLDKNVVLSSLVGNGLQIDIGKEGFPLFQSERASR